MYADVCIKYQFLRQSQLNAKNLRPFVWLLPVAVIRLHAGDLFVISCGEGQCDQRKIAKCP